MNHEAFIRDLIETLKKHGFDSLGGCGCCGSPFAYSGEKSIDDITIDLKTKSASYRVDSGQTVEIKITD
jgi:Fe-S oxidoreductase